MDPIANVMRTKPFALFNLWWPVGVIAIFGSYPFTGDRKPLGDAQSVFFTGRGLVILFCLLALIFLREPKWRAYIGHMIFFYTVFVNIYYYLTTEVHNKAFWGDVWRQSWFGLLIYALTIGSFTLLEIDKKLREANAAIEVH